MSLNPGVTYIKRAYIAQIKKHLGHQATLERVNKALDILVRDEYYSWIRVGPDRFIMLHVTQEQTLEYQVNTTMRVCTCPDAARGSICKHRQAMEMLLTAESLEKSDKGE
jgi:hypothetical protein